MLQLQPPSFGTAGRLARASTVADIRELARRRTPRAVFDYTDGAAGDEVSLARSRAAFARVEFRARVLRDVSAVDMNTEILGRPASLPLALGPTGFTRMMNYQGEPAVGRAALAAGLPYTLSTMGTTSPEDLAAAVPSQDLWFQLYLWRDRAASKELIARVRNSGFRTLMLTVDTPVGGARLRDVRNGLTIPPALTVRTLADMARYPHWWLNLLTTEPLTFASLTSTNGTVADMIDNVFDPAATFADLEWLRGVWSGPLLVKGVQTAEDARTVVELGADGVVISNHGGRQLDRGGAPLDELAAVLDQIGGRAEVFLDGGIMSGADVIAAVALGATACLIGRSYLYGLMAGGQAGVERVLQILRSEMVRTMQLIGVNSISDLDASSVRLIR
ncbi:MAG: alpha-hydroxy-acid oxidizing enzyme [Frankiales bacterium]|nr:alpha-hydroxy-acid oxidizing enzyme [Frankiales bacterium]